jgi:hypothetical protein
MLESILTSRETLPLLRRPLSLGLVINPERPKWMRLLDNILGLSPDNTLQISGIFMGRAIVDVEQGQGSRGKRERSKGPARSSSHAVASYRYP